MKKERAELVAKNHPKLSVHTLCELLEAPRSSLDYRPVAQSEKDRELMRLMDEIYLIDRCIGTRRLVKVLERDHGRKVNRKRLRRLRREMGLETIWCRPRHTSAPDKANRKYPYLLGSLEVKRARPGVVRGHHVRADVARVRVSVRGDGLVFAQGAGLAVVQNRWAFAWRRWRWRCGKPAVWGRSSTRTRAAKFTSEEWTGERTRLGIATSMDGKGRKMDNVFIQRLWHSVKHEDIYLREYASLPALEAGLEAWFERHNGVATA